MEQLPDHQATVRALPDEPVLTISLTLAGQQRNLCRDKTEALEKALGRIRTNAVPRAKKQKKAKHPIPNSLEASSRVPEDISVRLLLDDSSSSAIPEITPNEEAWQKGKVLKVGKTAYSVVYNPPILEKLVVLGQAMVGIPVCAIATAHFTEDSASQWQWARSVGIPGDVWEDIPGATAKVYQPQSMDEGKRLRVVCKPGRHGEGATVILGDPQELIVGVVRPGPALPAAAHRHPLTATPLEPPGVRVVTYNILADQYVATEYAQKVLFAYCPSKYRAPEYRRPLVLQELLGFNADIICLQEVDEKAFTQYFMPQLDHAGFEGYYTNKAGSTREGSATFFRRSRYRLMVSRELVLKDLLTRIMEDGGQSRHSQLLPILRSSASLRHNLEKVATIAQLTLLAPVHPTEADRPLCVANTHLFFHPRANHIRTIHTAVILMEAQQLIAGIEVSADLKKLTRGLQPGLLFCGDLNSGCSKGIPGALELLTRGELDAGYWDWDAGRTFRFVKDLEDPEAGSDGSEAASSASSTSEQMDTGFKSADLRVPFRLAAADGLRSLFTNYVRGFQGSLDFVWYPRSLMAVRREIPLPSEQELEGWIPSQRFPSDHLAVVFDLEWRVDAMNCQPGVTSSPSQPEHCAPTAAGSRIYPAEVENLRIGTIALNSGGVIAVPTDTLYGLAGNAEDCEAVSNIYKIKKRNLNMPLAICVGEADKVGCYGEVGHLPDGLLQKLLPGPVTLLLRRREEGPLAGNLNPGLQTIGVRVPDSDFIRKLCNAFGAALALTSANVSGSSSPLQLADFQELWSQCGVIYDGGVIDASPVGSTIVDLSSPGVYKIIRAGVAADTTIAVLEGCGLQCSG